MEDYGDLYQEVAAAYMDKGKYDLALALLQKIVDEEEVRYFGPCLLQSLHTNMLNGKPYIGN